MWYKNTVQDQLFSILEKNYFYSKFDNIHIKWDQPVYNILLQFTTLFHFGDEIFGLSTRRTVTQSNSFAAKNN